ncbi:MAG TPA: hypothetical protein VFC19_17035 [Candidatus Limnocylindrales bacterium]|nr:hypothetical protein [Candidatus Limnocylindrales bacterium]
MRLIRLLPILLGATALATVAVELLNWYITDDGGWALLVRTTWALLRSLAFLVLIWQVRHGRAGAPPFALILCVTTLFALARLVVPRQGAPDPRGVAGFAIVALLCAIDLFLLYRSSALRDHLTRHANRIVVTRKGIERRPLPPRQAPAPGWILTARIAALSYSPLMLVGAAVALGQIFAGRVAALPLVVVWFVAALAVSYATLLVVFFLLQRKRWATTALVVISILVILVDLPLCYVLLGTDGLLRDGGPLLFAALLALLALARARANGRRIETVPAAVNLL